MKVNREICVGCGGCVNICPRFSIRFIDNLAFIDQETCIECGTCRALCGVDAMITDCRFPDIVLLSFENNPFAAGKDPEG